MGPDRTIPWLSERKSCDACSRLNERSSKVVGIETLKSCIMLCRAAVVVGKDLKRELCTFPRKVWPSGVAQVLPPRTTKPQPPTCRHHNEHIKRETFLPSAVLCHRASVARIDPLVSQVVHSFFSAAFHGVQLLTTSS